VLVDDIDQVTVEDMKAQGLQPAAVVETSHRNCQAWVKIAPSLSREEAGGEFWRSRWEGPGSAGYQHYGRLAGFTNRKDNTWTIVPVDIPGSKWWKQRDKPPMPSASLPPVGKRSASPVSTRKQTVSQCVEPG